MVGGSNLGLDFGSHFAAPCPAASVSPFAPSFLASFAFFSADFFSPFFVLTFFLAGTLGFLGARPGFKAFPIACLVAFLTPQTPTAAATLGATVATRVPARKQPASASSFVPVLAFFFSFFFAASVQPPHCAVNHARPHDSRRGWLLPPSHA